MPSLPSSQRPPFAARLTAVGLLALHGAGFAWLAGTGRTSPLELFGLLLLAGSAVTCVALFRGWCEPLLGAGMLLLIVAQAMVGRLVAPDNLTGGAMLVANLLTLYVGLKLHWHLPARHGTVFAAGYLALFAIFILFQRNAEALFIGFLLALCACARSLRLTAYFWAFVISFTFCQPYAWETLLASWFGLAALFGARSGMPSVSLRLFLAAGLVLLFLVLLPVAVVLTGEDLHNLPQVLGDPRIRAAIRTTVWTATISTGILALLGIPLAYALSRLRFPGRAVLLSVIDLPVVIPQSAAGLALLGVFSRQQPLGALVERWTGLAPDGTALGICVAQVFVALPFLVKTAQAGFDAVPLELEQTARTLGASGWSTFLRVACPLAGRSLFAGVVLAWARAAGEFGAVLFLAPVPETAPVAAYNRFQAVGMSEAGPLVAALLLFSLALFFLLQLASRLLPETQRSRE